MVAYFRNVHEAFSDPLHLKVSLFQPRLQCQPCVLLPLVKRNLDLLAVGNELYEGAVRKGGYEVLVDKLVKASLVLHLHDRVHHLQRVGVDLLDVSFGHRLPLQLLPEE